MRIAPDQPAWDLYLCLACSLASAITSVVLGFPGTLAAAITMSTQGYAVVAAAFPEKQTLSWPERLMLSTSLSIALISVFGAVALSGYFRDASLMLSAVMVLAAALTEVAGLARRARLPHDKRLAGEIRLAVPGWTDASRGMRVLIALLTAGVVMSSAVAIYAFAASSRQQPYTGFYLTGHGGSTSGLPTRFNISQSIPVTIVVVNHEQTAVDYGVRVDLVGLRTEFNTSMNTTQAVEVNRSALGWFNATIQPGITWSIPYSLATDFSGYWEFDFSLLKNGLPTTQELRLLVVVG